MIRAILELATIAGMVLVILAAAIVVPVVLLLVAVYGLFQGMLREDRND